MEFNHKTTLCYLINEDSYLMLHRNKEKNDINEGKWLGIGGHIEKDETPEEAMIREFKEETGLDILNYQKRGIIYFHSGDIHEIMYLYTSDKFIGSIRECDEGTLKWVKIHDVLNLNLWEGDKYFLKELTANDKYFEMEFFYDGDKLVSYKKIR